LADVFSKHFVAIFLRHLRRRWP